MPERNAAHNQEHLDGPEEVHRCWHEIFVHLKTKSRGKCDRLQQTNKKKKKHVGLLVQ